MSALILSLIIWFQRNRGYTVFFLMKADLHISFEDKLKQVSDERSWKVICELLCSKDEKIILMVAKEKLLKDCCFCVNARSCPGVSISYLYLCLWVSPTMQTGLCPFFFIHMELASLIIRIIFSSPSSSWYPKAFLYPFYSRSVASVLACPCCLHLLSIDWLLRLKCFSTSFGLLTSIF